jgi:hypothetical protein
MSEQRETNKSGRPVEPEFAKQMEVARKIMDERWITLRALALADQYPDADAETLVKMAEEQARERPQNS